MILLLQILIVSNLVQAKTLTYEDCAALKSAAYEACKNQLLNAATAAHQQALRRHDPAAESREAYFQKMTTIAKDRRNGELDEMEKRWELENKLNRMDNRLSDLETEAVRK